LSYFNNHSVIFNVVHNKILANKYRLKSVGKHGKISLAELKNDLTIIPKNMSAIFICDGKVVGGVVRKAAKNNVSSYFGAMMKVTTNAHRPFKRGKAHAGSGIMVGHGLRKEPHGSLPGNYVYKEKLNPEAKKIYDSDGNTLANWIYESARSNLSWITISYEEFKRKVKFDEGKIIGALFCTKNYEAIGHSDDDRSDWALGYVYEDGIVKDGLFFYPEYGVAIEMASNSMWYWMSQAVHGTAKLDLSEGGNRFTAVITLTERTANAIEKLPILKNL